MSENKTDPNEEAIKAYFNQWKVYDQIIRNDYMAHNGIHQALRKDLSIRRRPFTVLDLGCGDASQMARTLHGLPVQAYFGVDLSWVALEEGRKNMGPVADKTSFFEMDFMSFLESGIRETVDVIVAGYTVHHLGEVDKRRLFHLCSNMIREGGVFYYYDLFRREGETREQFFEDYFSHLDSTWLDLSPETRAQTKDHAMNCDHPETYGTIATIALETGFTLPNEPIFQDSYLFHRLYCFIKPK